MLQSSFVRGMLGKTLMMQWTKWFCGSITLPLYSSALVSLSLLNGCSHPIVKCEGINKNPKQSWIMMPAGECKKIAGSHPQSIPAQEAQKVKRYPYNSYIKCYGIAAAGMNDCGTAISACGGSVEVARSPDAWIALPKGICEQLEGARIEKNTHSAKEQK